MKILIVYDSFFGNTEKIAKEIYSTLFKKHDIKLKKVSECTKKDLLNINLLIMGSPTRAFSPSEETKKFIETNPFENIEFIVFDTRIDINDVSKFLQFLIKIFGYADTKMAKTLSRKGGKELIQSKGFYVQDKEGPLKSTELEKAGSWLKNL